MREGFFLSEMVRIIQGELLQVPVTRSNLFIPASKLCTDTRSIGKGELFVALKGENFNGNDFVEDACKTALTIDEHNELIQIFSLEGWQGLWKNNILSRIKSLRNERTISKKLVEAIEIKDFIIVVDKPEHYNMAYIAHELMKKGAKGAAYLTEFPTYVKISLRLSKNLSEQEIDRYRVDLLAKRLNGGGHKPAAGAQTRTLTEALEKIELWAKTNDFTFEIIDLRNRKKK